MPITPKDTFDTAIARARHLLLLYDILHDRRQRNVRADWKIRFCGLMHWPQSEEIVRIDGENQNSMLILRAEVGMSRDEFTHDYISELLRGTITSAVSALDRYIHDQIVNHAIKLLSRAEADIPKELRQLRLPALTVKRSLEKLKADDTSKPGTILKRDLQEMLHRDETFQTVSGVERGARMLGIKDFWAELTKKIPAYTKSGDVQESLRKIATRRNQIVHEADVISQQRAREVKLRDITKPDAEHALTFIETFVSAFDALVTEAC